VAEPLLHDLGSPRKGPNVWGIKMVVTTQMTAGTVLVGNFATAAKLFVREEPRIETSRGGAAEFNANISLIRAEVRLALAVVRQTALVKITGM
jgi:HK97 family phage major capsid protein